LEVFTEKGLEGNSLDAGAGKIANMASPKGKDLHALALVAEQALTWSQRIAWRSHEKPVLRCGWAFYPLQVAFLAAVYFGAAKLAKVPQHHCERHEWREVGWPMICTAVKTAKSKLLEAGLAGPNSFEGCTEEEIQCLEARFSLHLPKCYRDFLVVMGRAAGKFLVGTDYSFPKMLDFRKEAEGLLRTSQSNFKLSPTAFVFMFHQGYTFLFFDCHGDPDDPPVLMFTEAENEPREVANSFSSWLLTAVEDDIAAYRELEAR
jgi:hypothetical protein